jgi:hypothetical protein
MVLAAVAAGVCLGVTALGVLAYFPGKPSQELIDGIASVESDDSDDEGSDDSASRAADLPSVVAQAPSLAASEAGQRHDVSTRTTVRQRRRQGHSTRPLDASGVAAAASGSAVVTPAAVNTQDPQTLNTQLAEAVFGTTDAAAISKIIAKAKRTAERQVWS